MKLVQIYISSAIFVILTVIRIAFPVINNELVSGINSALEMETRQTETAIEYGEKTADRLFGGEPAAKQKSMKCLNSEKRRAEVFGDEIRYRIDSDEKEGLKEKEESDKVATFASSQAQYSGAVIPKNVFLEIPDLGFEYSSPVDGVKSSGFGYRIHPISGELKFHYGTDFAANTGTPVKAFADGTIVAAGNSDSYGKYLIIDHGNGYTSLYAHCSELCVGCGGVKRGDTIALVGETGLATGPHLHFEIMHDEYYLNPEFYL
ncbi:MAG: M23 family metallopeptidase [Bacillota bacterium]|nr:M23 family metallopeptidase [Bacillota bacterium]